jgi:RNA polymerase-binding transcription factor DksA
MQYPNEGNIHFDRQTEGKMKAREKTKFRTQLRELAKRIQGTASSAEEQARTTAGGEQSSAPLHLGDVGSEEFTQELGATLLENEQYLQTEINAALDRLEGGTFGRCENCGEEIALARLQAIPYARFCVACATKLQSAPAVNLNEGRPKSWTEGIGLRAGGPPPGAPGGPEKESVVRDSHAAGTPGGGTAIGGLAGTNIGTGEPEGDDLEEAFGSGTFDVSIEEEQPGEGGYSGLSGGAVGGTPANKRVTGGKTPKSE